MAIRDGYERLGMGGAPGREQTECDPGQQRYAGGKGEHSPIGAKRSDQPFALRAEQLEQRLNEQTAQRPP
jgi:hypothetical protein